MVQITPLHYVVNILGQFWCKLTTANNTRPANGNIFMHNTHTKSIELTNNI